MDWEITEEISPSNVLANSRRTRAIPVKGELQKESISVKVKFCVKNWTKDKKIDSSRGE